ncbi:MAG TPA: hypothetical protein VMS22_03440 [Candidatus Eisenbacteria bacterium]|nr:hypothetical protein [Candidatus Eisenbacteria bacterium]
MGGTIIGSGIPSVVVPAGCAGLGAGALVFGALALALVILVVADVRSAS